MTRRRFLFFSELLAICFLCFFGGLGHSSGQIVSCRAVASTFVGRPFTHLYPSGSCVFKSWKRVVPIHSSESKTSLIIPIIFQRMFGGVVDVCSRLPHDIDGCVFWDVQLCSMYCVMAIYEVTTHNIFTVSFFVDSVPFFLFILLRISPGGHFAELGLRKIEGNFGGDHPLPHVTHIP